MKKILVAVCIAVSIMLISGCGSSREDTEGNDKMSGTLTFAIWDDNLNEVMESNHMVEKFQKKYPDIEIEIEKIKDDSEYWNIMEMRAAANQLPDLMLNKTFTLSRFQEDMVDLKDAKAAENNMWAKEYAIDGRVLGIPMTSGYEYVYYWKDMFEQAGVEVPATWEEFQAAAEKLQDFYGEEEGFAALACGLKDEWTDYPYMEFMPALESGNGENWDDMAKQDMPFSEGTDIFQAYQKVERLFSSGALGPNPLNQGNNQATQLFAKRKAAMIALGDWGLQYIKNETEDLSGLGTFYLPVREGREEPFYVIVQPDNFLGITTHSEHQEAAEAFVEWFYSEDWYPEYIQSITAASSMSNFPKDKDPVLAEADELCPDRKMVFYNGGGSDFTAIQNEIIFDYKKLGAEMAAEEFDFKKRMEELNARWAEARKKLNIN